MRTGPSLKPFVVLSFIVAAGAGFLAIALIVLLSNGQLYQQLLEWVALRYSADGQITEAGLMIIRKTTEILFWVTCFGAVSILALGFLLRRIQNFPQAIEPVGNPGSKNDPTAHSSRFFVLASSILLFAAAMVRFPRLFSSFSYDEIFSIQHFTEVPFFRIPFVQEGFNNHILNSLLIHFIQNFSSAEASFRLPVFAAGIFSLWLIVRLGKHIGGESVGLFALALAAASPYHLWYSTLARGYMLGLFLGLFGLWILSTASMPPRPRSLWLFGVSQVLAVWAMPTLVLLPLSLAGMLMASHFSSIRRMTGIDASSPTGRAWLAASLWTLVVAFALNFQMVPFILRLVAEIEGMAFGASLSGAASASWFGSPRFASALFGSILGLSVFGFLGFLQRKEGQREWRQRFISAFFAFSIVLFVATPTPPRIHAMAFAGLVLLGALGIQTLIRWVVLSRVVVLFIVGLIGLSSWSEVIASYRGVPLQGLREAVQVAESRLPQEGLILTSGFSQQELGYYTHRSTRWISAAEDPAFVVASHPAACYLRLYANLDPEDPVLGYFKNQGSPVATVLGSGDSIAVWCFAEGKWL
ncbi:MAG: glycosyltransferase family 39 protein [Candidatus Omnitrophica bacterium]|nr:glycosyltransferase family 39 protein [Candidatus Omnitrophota bacterium]